MFPHKILPPAIFLIGAALVLCPSPAWCVELGGVMPAALDQPHIYALIRTTPTGPPLEYVFPFEGFVIDAYLDTGASGIMLSALTTEFLNLQTKFARYPDGNGVLQDVIFQDIGVGGTQDFNVTTPLYLGMAKYHPDIDGTTAVPFNQPVGPVQLQMAQADNIEVGYIDVVGMPAMLGKVVVMDPRPVDSMLDSMRTYIYNPGTPFNPAALDTEPGIPNTNAHVRLSYAAFDKYTRVLPPGATGPTLAASPFIGPNPVTGASADVPGITIDFDGLKTTGSFLFDSGAGTSMISSAMAANLNVRYRPGTQGTDNPILERLDSATSQWTQIDDQYTMQIGGIGGVVNVAGFFLDDMLVRSAEGNAANDADPKHLKFLSTPMLVYDITLMDPLTNETLTLDGIFGMNNLVANAMIIPGDPIPSIFGQTLGNFNWVVFDQPNGLLGLDLKPPVSAWTGGGSSELYMFINEGIADTNWSCAANWEGVSPSRLTTLVFSQSAPVTTNNFNDFPDGSPFKGITFSGAAAFTLGGNRVALTGDVINDSAVAQTINLDLELSGANRAFAANTGDLVALHPISGDFGLEKIGPNKLILQAANTYTGPTLINEGTLTLDGGDLSDASLITVADGAALQVLSGTPTLGGISGLGTLLVAGPATRLTAPSITASALAISSTIPASVPEPSAFMLLGVGLTALLMYCLPRRGKIG